jgi:hypothetical protein
MKPGPYIEQLKQKFKSFFSELAHYKKKKKIEKNKKYREFRFEELKAYHHIIIEIVSDKNQLLH